MSCVEITGTMQIKSEAAERALKEIQLAEICGATSTCQRIVADLFYTSNVVGQLNDLKEKAR